MLNRLTAKATGLEVLTGSTESATVGNFAIQLAALEGNYTDGIGVTANAVAEWAGVLAAQPIDVWESVLWNRCLGNEASGRCAGKHVPAQQAEESQRPTGKALV